MGSSWGGWEHSCWQFAPGGHYRPIFSWRGWWMRLGRTRSLEPRQRRGVWQRTCNTWWWCAATRSPWKWSANPSIHSQLRQWLTVWLWWLVWRKGPLRWLRKLQSWRSAMPGPLSVSMWPSIPSSGLEVVRSEANALMPTTPCVRRSRAWRSTVTWILVAPQPRVATRTPSLHHATLRTWATNSWPPQKPKRLCGRHLSTTTTSWMSGPSTSAPLVSCVQLTCWASWSLSTSTPCPFSAFLWISASRVSSSMRTIRWMTSSTRWPACKPCRSELRSWWFPCLSFLGQPQAQANGKSSVNGSDRANVGPLVHARSSTTLWWSEGVTTAPQPCLTALGLWSTMVSFCAPWRWLDLQVSSTTPSSGPSMTPFASMVRCLWMMQPLLAWWLQAFPALLGPT